MKQILVMDVLPEVLWDSFAPGAQYWRAEPPLERIGATTASPRYLRTVHRRLEAARIRRRSLLN